MKFPDMVLKVPHMGWNSLKIMNPDHPIYLEIPQESFVYFVHSFYGNAEDPTNILTKTEYGIEFASSVGTSNVFATQFHPEKSGAIGMKILTNYLQFAKR
jgi:glutamine amidotransferase